ncbi:MAG: aspartate kinase [Bdellovibrionaceae bacterium]|nr:aspartate kinase [Pseudobdellovibrionaceae bacterium]
MSKTNGTSDVLFENLVVQKFGGATLADPRLVRAAAERVYDQSKKGPLIVVVSAMGTTTNSLIELATQVSRRPARRELDMLLSVGERISMSLMSMALQDLGASAISFTGSQAGILTDDDHFNAKIIDVKAHRVQDALKAGKIVILAGFQGVSPVTKEITTLGRGGSDVTAVALAAAFGAKRCEILKEVPAILTGDPRVIPETRPLSALDYEELLEMTFWGAKVLHHRSVELARARQVNLYIGPAIDEDAPGTLVEKGAAVFETLRPLSLNSHESVLEIELLEGSPDESLKAFRDELTQLQIAAPQLLSWSGKSGHNRILVTAPQETLKAIREAMSKASAPRVVGGDLCSVTMTCSGGVGTELSTQILEVLKGKGIIPKELRIGPCSVSVFLESAQRTEALRSLHPLIP